jgi:hypothetical protein
MDSSLAANSRATQSSAVKAWERFCSLMKVQSLCTGYSTIEMETHVASFIGFEIGLRGMSPFSVKRTYLPAITSSFVSRGIRNEFGKAVQSPFVRYLLRGYMAIAAKIHPAGEMKKLAFTIELVKYTKPAILASSFQRKGERLFIKAASLAMTFGIYFLLRKSEYLPGHSAGVFHKGLRWDHVRFFSPEGIRILWSDVRLGLTKVIEINIAVSKTDRFGLIGRLVKHTRVDSFDCIVHKMEKWLIYSRDQLSVLESDTLFHCKSIGTIISDNEVAAIMKSIVVHLGWSAKKISAHSLRYGGATMLAAAGLPQYVIAYFGGWSEDSKSLRRYTQVGGDAVTRVSNIMSSGFNKSLEESRIRSYQTHSST